MRVMYAVTLLAAIVTGCSDSPDPDGSVATTPTVQVNTGTPAERATADVPPVVVGGKSYKATFHACAQQLWDGRVGQWNALSQADRDRVAGGSVAWMKAKGWPTSYEATLDAASTRKACPA